MHSLNSNHEYLYLHRLGGAEIYYYMGPSGIDISLQMQDKPYMNMVCDWFATHVLCST